AMNSDLVAFGHYPALLIGIEHRRDGRHEKAGGHRVLRQQRENSRDTLAVAVLALAQATDRFAALPQLARVMVAVEGERDSATRAAGPGCGLQRPARAHAVDDPAPRRLRPLPGLECCGRMRRDDRHDDLLRGTGVLTPPDAYHV